MYREQTFVERCFCAEPATRGCQCCGRARCETHLERALCNRCSQFVGRELDQRANRPWAIGGAFGAAITLGSLAMGTLTCVLLGIPVGLLASWSYRRVERARMIRALGPAMSASHGELPPPSHELEFSEDSYLGSRNNTPPYGGV